MQSTAYSSVIARRRTSIQVSLILLALVLRMTLFIIASADENRFIRPDSMDYIRPAVNVLDHGAFSSSTEEPFEPEFDRVPGFPLFIMAVFSLFGRSITYVVLLLVVLDSFVPAIIYRIGERWRSWKVGAAAGALYAVGLLPVIACQHALSDSMFTFFLSLQILFYIRFFQEGRTRDLVLSALVLGIMTLIRSIALYWIVILLGTILLRRPLPRGSRPKRILASALIFAAIVAPWMVRNYQKGAGPRLDVNAPKTVRYYFAAAVEAELTGTPAGDIRERWKQEDLQYFESNPDLFPNEDSRANYKTHMGYEVLKNHPLVFIKLSTRPYALMPAIDAFYEQIGVSTGGKGTLDVLTREGPWAAVVHYFDGKTWLLLPVVPWILILAVTYLGCLRGLYLVIKERAWEDLLTFAFFALYYIAIMGTNTLSRYRLPAMPAIVLMAGLGITYWKRRSEYRR